MDDDRSPLAGTDVHYLASENVNGEFKIFVGHCPGDRSRRPGVLCLTDANGLFGVAVDLIRGMQLSRHLPPLLVVGIGYRRGGIADTLAQRTRDLTPTEFPAFGELAPDQSVMGGARALLAFIREELMPWVGSTYDVEPGDTTYFGHSFGGLFGTWALFDQLYSFRRYILGSPSLWWDDGLLFRIEEEYAAAHDDLEACVFFGVGADETHSGRIREAARESPDQRALTASVPIDLVADMQRMVDRLETRRYPGLELTGVVFPDEFHVTVAPLVLSRGLRHVLGAPR
jgi:predicted alpha/beta superfamily hydrolase